MRGTVVLKRAREEQLVGCLEYSEAFDASRNMTGDYGESCPASSKCSDASAALIWCDEDRLEDGWPTHELCPNNNLMDIGTDQGSDDLVRLQQMPACRAQATQQQEVDSWQQHVSSQSNSVTNSSSPGMLPVLPGVTPRVRSFAVDVMIRAAHQLQLGNDSLFLAVGVLDRYLAIQPNTPEALAQAVAIACLFIAAKFQDVIVPPSSMFAAQMTATPSAPGGIGQPNVQLLLHLEATVLQALDWRLANIDTTHTAKHFLLERYAATAAGVSLPVLHRALLLNMTSYLSEAALLEYNLIKYQPEVLAGTAFACAHFLLGLPLDLKVLQHVTGGYTLQDLSVPSSWLFSVHQIMCQALRDSKPYYVTLKYCADSAGGVARVPPLTSWSDERIGLQAGPPQQQQQQQQQQKP